MSTLISIVIPFYSTPENFFQMCIQSMLDVERTDFEIIIVDDGSPLSFYPVLEQFSGDSRVKIHHYEKRGVSAARNTGIQLAKGKWITFVDSDDYLDSAAFNRILDLAAANQGDVVLFNGGQDKNGIISKNHYFLKEDHDYGINQIDRISLIESALSLGKIPKGFKQYFTLGSPCCKLFNSAFLREKEILFDEKVKFAEDTLFMMSVYNNARHILYYDIYLYSYVVNNNSATRKFRPSLDNDMDVFFERAKLFIQNNHLNKELEKAYYTRAQTEVSRAFSLQFFHPQNQDTKARSAYLEFIQKEPYHTALQKKYIQPGNIRQKMMQTIIIRGWGRLYNMIKTIKK